VPPIETINGFSSAVRWAARQMASEADALPPGVLRRRTTDWIEAEVRASSSASTSGVDPMTDDVGPKGLWLGAPVTMFPSP
jgi:hypothetical protein